MVEEVVVVVVGGLKVGGLREQKNATEQNQESRAAVSRASEPQGIAEQSRADNWRVEDGHQYNYTSIHIFSHPVNRNCGIYLPENCAGKERREI